MARKAARGIDVAPNCPNVNNVRILIIDHLVEGAVNAFPGNHPYGRNVHILMDKLATFSDYTVTCPVSDFIGLTAS